VSAVRSIIVLTLLCFAFYGLHFINRFGGGQIQMEDGGALRLQMGGQSIRSARPSVYYPLNWISKDLITAVILQEDQDFFSHRGYSLDEMAKSLYTYIAARGRLRGASTISQQLARTLFLDREKSARRKFLELRIARILEDTFEKNQILELYLNHVYWGKGKSGIAQASFFYFRARPDRLTRYQSAFLVSLLPNPDACPEASRCADPRVKRRIERLLRLMEKMDSAGAGSR